MPTLLVPALLIDLRPIAGAGGAPVRASSAAVTVAALPFNEPSRSPRSSASGLSHSTSMSSSSSIGNRDSRGLAARKMNSSSSQKPGLE